MGTTYHIKFKGGDSLEIHKGVDSLLLAFNNSLSTYIPSSTISKFNNSKDHFCFSKYDDHYFNRSFTEAKIISEITNGIFQPTIMPLVNYWGFGYGKRDKVITPSKAKIDSLLQLIGMDKIQYHEHGDSICISKSLPGVQLDFSASAKGHGVDEVLQYIKGHHIDDVMVEIGGEVRTSGYNAKGESWVIGINKPSAQAGLDEVEIPVFISNMAMATSGNYRNFYQNGEIVYSHIIDPISGIARPSNILSASVIASDCLTADAYATAFMVLGFEKSKQLIEKLDGIEACFLFASPDGKRVQHYYTSGFNQYLKQNK